MTILQLINNLLNSEHINIILYVILICESNKIYKYNITCHIVYFLFNYNFYIIICINLSKILFKLYINTI